MSASSVQASRDFGGKVTFVSGASRVIGAATARLLAPARRLDRGFCTGATLQVNGGIVLA